MQIPGIDAVAAHQKPKMAGEKNETGAKLGEAEKNMDGDGMAEPMTCEMYRRRRKGGRSESKHPARSTVSSPIKRTLITRPSLAHPSRDEVALASLNDSFNIVVRAYFSPLFATFFTDHARSSFQRTPFSSSTSCGHHPAIFQWREGGGEEVVALHHRRRRRDRSLVLPFAFEINRSPPPRTPSSSREGAPPFIHKTIDSPSAPLCPHARMPPSLPHGPSNIGLNICEISPLGSLSRVFPMRTWKTYYPVERGNASIYFFCSITRPRNNVPRSKTNTVFEEKQTT